MTTLHPPLDFFELRRLSLVTTTLEDSIAAEDHGRPFEYAAAKLRLNILAGFKGLTAEQIRIKLDLWLRQAREYRPSVEALCFRIQAQAAADMLHLVVHPAKGRYRLEPRTRS